MLIRFNESRILDAFGVTIVPGIQEIDAELFAKMKTNKTLKYKLEHELIEVISEDADAIAAFLLMKPSQIKNILKSTHDLQLLSDWLAREARESVRALVKERVKAISTIEYRDGTKGTLELPPPRVASAEDVDDELDDLELDEPVAKKPKARSKK